MVSKSDPGHGLVFLGILTGNQLAMPGAMPENCIQITLALHAGYNQTDQTDPTHQTDLTDPTDPTDPTAPTDLADQKDMAISNATLEMSICGPVNGPTRHVCHQV